VVSTELRVEPSPGQRRLWFLDRFDGGDPAHHVVAHHRLTGPLDAGVLHQALEEVVRRHEPLRTGFDDVDGVPLPQVVPADRIGTALVVPFEVVDARGEVDPAARALVVARRAAEEPFDLAAPPLLRAALVRTADGEHLLSLCVHHIATDGWSMAVLRGEVAALYEAFLAGRPSPLPPLPAGYGDHLARLAAPQHAARVAASADHWTQALAGAPQLTPPLDRRRPAEPRPDRGAAWQVPVPAELVDAVRILARAHRCSPFMVWLAAYQALLSRWCGQDDVCVATPVANRDRPELEGLVGYFSSVVVLRGDLSAEPGFGDLLRRTRTAALSAFRHADLPFEEVLGRLQLGRDGHRHPLYQTWLNVHTETLDGLPVTWAPGLVVEPLAWPPAPAAGAPSGPVPLDRAYDLAVDFWPGDDALYLTFSYDRDLFDEATVADLGRRFLRLLAAVAADPLTPIGALDLLEPGEAGSVLAGPQVAAGSDGCTVVHLLHEQARRTPGAAAVVHGERTWTYAELDARAAAVAAALRAHGMPGGTGAPDGEEPVVAVCAGRSPELVAAFLGTLRAGAVYLPLDPAYPDARLAFMVQDSGAVLVLADAPGAERMRAAAGVPVLPLDDVPVPAVGREVATDDDVGARPDGLAYVIYTSGSTGVPKGVGVEHGGLAARVRWMRDSYPITAADRVLQFASTGFDTHAEELYPVLAAGGTLVVPTVAPELLPEWLPTPAGRSVTVLDLPTAYWHRLVHDLPPQLWPPALRLMIIGGAAADPDAVAAWREAFGDRVDLLNTYGPTESTIVATAARLTAADTTRRPSIGTPAAGSSAAVLDRGGRPVPVGFPGELHLGGAGVARGYLGRPGLTAERFPPDPAGPPSGRPGARLFRTGDLVRLRRDGGLEFLGRVDRQVKIRGYRIEPGEVEAALLAGADVAQAAVVVHAGGGSGGAGGADPVLAAYLVPVPGAVLVPDDVRRRLERSLPPYLVPGAIAVLDALPLTPNGKLDVAALPAPSAVLAAAPRPYVAPRTDAEELVADVWAEVLGLERVGALDDFFALGGHSLLATRVTARLRAAVDVELPLRVLFTTPSVADVAAAVEELLMSQIDALSDEEVDRMLAQQAERTPEAGPAQVAGQVLEARP